MSLGFDVVADGDSVDIVVVGGSEGVVAIVEDTNSSVQELFFKSMLLSSDVVADEDRVVTVVVGVSVVVVEDDNLDGADATDVNAIDDVSCTDDGKSDDVATTDAVTDEDGAVVGDDDDDGGEDTVVDCDSGVPVCGRKSQR